MSKLQPVRGTHDIYGDDARRMRHVVETFARVASTYGFEELATPIFEFTEVFKRPLGEASDIVSKEMYSFRDRGDEELTLRPEFTAGVARAFISGGMQQSTPCRFMSWGPVFRYERPQKGRYRQFHQLNAECLGPSDPATDVDMIALGYRTLMELGVAGDVVLNLNTLGDPDSRNAYRSALVEYFSDHRDALSEDSQRRLLTNPLRILDSKIEGDQAIVVGAPKLSGYLNDQSRDFFRTVTNGLERAGVPFVHNERLVRGLDYYTHTAFEFITEILGAQGTVIGGGRYDGLIKKLGGPPVAGVGWAGGIERLAMMLAETPTAVRPVFFLPMGDAALLEGFKICEELRGAGITVIADRTGNISKRMNRANKASARAALILGDDELSAGTIMVKNLDSGDQQQISIDGLAKHLKAQG